MIKYTKRKKSISNESEYGGSNDEVSECKSQCETINSSVYYRTLWQNQSMTVMRNPFQKLIVVLKNQPVPVNLLPICLM